MGAQKSGGDPCCDHTDMHKMSKDCAQACATSCAVAVVAVAQAWSTDFLMKRAVELYAVLAKKAAVNDAQFAPTRPTNK